MLLAVLLLTGCGCGGGDGDTAATTTTSATSTTTTSTTAASTTPTTRPATPEEEVEAAYLRSWEVYAEAVRDLDPSGLEESYAGEALEVVMGEVQRRRSERAPVRVEVDHDYTIQILDGGANAIVHDRYRNRSVRLDPETGAPAEAVEETKENEIYQLQRVGETWKVIVVARPEKQPERSCRCCRHKPANGVTQ